MSIGVPNGFNVLKNSKPPDYLQQMLDLELAAVDAKYSGSGGGGGGGYSGGGGGVNTSSLQKMGDVGDQKLADLYGSLGNYIKTGAADAKAQFDDAISKSTGYYDQGAQNIQKTAADVKQQIMDQAGLSPAGQPAGTDQAALANAAIQRQAAIQETNKANSLSTLQKLESGHQAIANETLWGAALEGNAQRARLKDLVASQIAQAQASAARYSGGGGGGGGGSSNAGKAEAAKLGLMAKYLGKDAERTQAAQKTAQQQRDSLTPQGIRAVQAYAKQVGRPELADQFMKMVSGSRQTHAQSVVAASMDPAHLLKPIDAKSVLLQEIDKVRPAGDPQYDRTKNTFNEDFINFIKNDPVLQRKLGKYIRNSPQYEQILGQMKEVRDPHKNDALSKALGWKPKSDEKGSLFDKTFNSIITDKVNKQLRELPFNQRYTVDPMADSDYNAFQHVLQKQMSDAEILNQLYNLYVGGV
jgi:hypothetical protein